MEGLSIMMKLTFKHLLVVSVILTLFLGLSLVSATDVTDDNAVSTRPKIMKVIVMRILKKKIMVIMSVIPMVVL